MGNAVFKGHCECRDCCQKSNQCLKGTPRNKDLVRKNDIRDAGSTTDLRYQILNGKNGVTRRKMLRNVIKWSAFQKFST